ncbi:unnamed protein product [Dovyalis caffra]|uniref:CASP-like protein n=1 Tax=Dovyalis caffra TaxID=77055 RepID=A0AAV1RQC5_9ROSI|nr:unnamed protein product [Dovyalis caffra]
MLVAAILFSPTFLIKEKRHNKGISSLSEEGKKEIEIAYRSSYHHCLAIFHDHYEGVAYGSEMDSVLLAGHRLHFDILVVYLLVSASSSAATWVDDWQSNWGKDEFTEMATASVVMAFLAFIAYTGSSLISGYNLYNHNAL